MKACARGAADEIAGELVNLYAERKTRKGHAFSPDSEWQMSLKRTSPAETADQIEAIEAVKADMESEQPMDRLVCGDVGYGKTEVAIQAAVKAASDGKQVMIPPRPRSAQQHLGTFRERPPTCLSGSTGSATCASPLRSNRWSPNGAEG